MEHVQANGVRFAYLSEGEGPLVLFLHGFPDTAYSWERVMPEVARLGYRAVAPFMRGYHPTAIPADGAYDGDTLGRDVLALIQALGAANAIVVGHDWGALAAYTAAAMGPDRVRALYTVGVPHPASVVPTPSMVWQVRHFIVLRRANAAARIRANDFEYVDCLVRRWSPAWADIPAAETARVKEAFAHPGVAEAACAYYAALRPCVSAALKKKITVPSVAFAGLDDNFDVDLYERARRCFAGPYDIAPVPGGHFMHREHPAAFLGELTRRLGPAK